jgi:UDP-N-acetylmuramate dehydrogenase
MPALAAKVAQAGLAGLAFGIAIPGSLGGAVRMNAGAHGGELSEVLEWAEVARLGRGGALERLPAAALGMRYRHTELPDDAVVVRARLRLAHSTAADIEAAMDEMRRWRREHQPLNEPSCGSVFRNPDGDSAGRLIDAAGMKDHRVGRARVSPKHANFITAEPGARAGDVHRVIRDVQEAVRAEHGVELETEVVLVGFDDAAAPDGVTA